MSDAEITVPRGYCRCGCGEKTTIAAYDNPEYGWVKGEPRRYRVGHARRQPLVDRFWNNVEVGADHDCWTWTGPKGSNEYGCVMRDGRRQMAHRLSLELHLEEPVPDDKQVHHVCENKRCVNPHHLVALTVGEHTQAHLAPTCPHGHEYTPENTYRYKGQRQCRTCAKLYQRKLRAARPSKMGPRICKTCGESFTPTAGVAKFCSDACRPYLKKAPRKTL